MELPVAQADKAAGSETGHHGADQVREGDSV